MNPIERVKTLMKYDTSLTLKENFENEMEEGIGNDLRVAADESERINILMRRTGLGFKEIQMAVGDEIGNLLRNFDQAAKKDLSKGFNTGGGMNIGNNAEKIRKQLIVNKVLNHPNVDKLTGKEIARIINETENETLMRFKNIESKFKPKVPPAPVPPAPVPPAPVGPGFWYILSDVVKRKWSSISGKLSKKWLWALGLLGLAGAAYYAYAKENGIDPNTQPPFPDCINNLLDDEGCRIGAMNNGDPYVSLIKTGNEEYDKLGGLNFFINKRVFSIDGTHKGRWSCNTSTTPINESDTKLKSRKMLVETYKYYLGEQNVGQGDGNPNTGINGITITWDAPGGGNTPTTPTTPTPNRYPIPPELKDITGVQNFQNWLDKTHPGWHDKYGTLDGNVQHGFGTYGPRTTRMWAMYKNEYLGSQSSAPTNGQQPLPQIDNKPIRTGNTINQLPNEPAPDQSKLRPMGNR